VSIEVERTLLKFFNTFHSTFNCNYKKLTDIFLRAYERDLYGSPSIERLLIEYLVRAIDAFRGWSTDTLHEMRNFVEHYRGNYKRICVVDCLGLPELYAIWCEAYERGFIVEVKVFVNRKAITKAFEEVFGVETLTDAARHTDGIVLRRLDTLLHSEMFREPRDRNEFANLLIGRMKYVASLLLSLVEGDTMILSDHGYDIISLNSKYVAKHTHIPKSKIALARLAPVVLLKQLQR